jgi:hypothetical protein
MRALLAISSIFCLLVGTAFGYLLSQYHFPRATAHELSQPLRVSSSVEAGLLPLGTRMHYQSHDRDHVRFYVFVRVPLDQATLLIKPVASGDNGGNRTLEAQP